MKKHSNPFGDDHGHEHSHQSKKAPRPMVSEIDASPLKFVAVDPIATGYGVRLFQMEIPISAKNFNHILVNQSSGGFPLVATETVFYPMIGNPLLWKGMDHYLEKRKSPSEIMDKSTPLKTIPEVRAYLQNAPHGDKTTLIRVRPIAYFNECGDLGKETLVKNIRTVEDFVAWYGAENLKSRNLFGRTPTSSDFGSGMYNLHAIVGEETFHQWWTQHLSYPTVELMTISPEAQTREQQRLVQNALSGESEPFNSEASMETESSTQPTGFW